MAVQATGGPHSAASCHSRGALPDPVCTPGDPDPRVTQANIHQTICVTGYTATVRPPLSVTERIKRERVRAYGVTGSLSTVELDHLIPLEVGGASTVSNLWPEPWAGTQGAHAKDKTENALKAAVCSGRMTLADAQHRIATDWITAIP